MVIFDGIELNEEEECLVVKGVSDVFNCFGDLLECIFV